MRHERVVYECDRCHSESLAAMACLIRVESLQGAVQSFTLHHVCMNCAKTVLPVIKHTTVPEVQSLLEASNAFIGTLALSGHPVAQRLDTVRGMSMPADVPKVQFLLGRLKDAKVNQLPIDTVSRLLCNFEQHLLPYEAAALQMVLHYVREGTPVSDWSCDATTLAAVTGRKPDGDLIQTT